MLQVGVPARVGMRCWALYSWDCDAVAVLPVESHGEHTYTSFSPVSQF